MRQSRTRWVENVVKTRFEKNQGLAPRDLCQTPRR